MPISSDFNLENFMPKVDVDDTEEVDFLQDSIMNFDFETVNTKFVVRNRHLGRPDLIAKDTLGSEVYWWVIFIANDLDPTEGLELGQELEIPQPSEVFEALEQHRDV